MGRLFDRLLRASLDMPFRDPQCGLTLFRRDAAHTIFHRTVTDGFARDVEVILIAMQLGYRVNEMRVCWTNHPESKVTLVPHPVQMLADLWRIRRTVADAPLQRAPARKPAP